MSPRTSRRSAAAWGMLLGYAGVALAIARNIVLVPVYLKFVTLAEYGAWLATGAAIVQWLITDFGLAGVLMQRSAALHGAGDTSRLGAVMGSGMLIGICLAACLCLLGAVAIPWVPAMKGLTPAESESLRQCLYLAVLASALGVVAAIAQGLVRSLQHAAAAGLIFLAADLAGILVTLIGLAAHAGLLALAYGMVARSTLMATGSSACLLWVTRSRFSLTCNLDWSSIRKLFADAWISFIANFAMKSQTQANTFVVGVVLGPTSAAVYGLTVRAHETVLQFLAQMNGAFAPSMAHLLGSGHTERFRMLVGRIVLAAALLAGIGMAITVCINQTFLRLWVNHPVFAGQSTSILMAIAIWLSAVGYIAYDALYALGRFNLIARTYVAAGVVHIVLLVTLLHFGLWGAPLTTAMTALLWGGLFWRRVIVEAQLRGSELRGIAIDLAIVAGCTLSVATAFLLSSPREQSWTGLVTTAVGCALAVVLCALLASTRIRTIVRDELILTVRSLWAHRQT